MTKVFHTGAVFSGGRIIVSWPGLSQKATKRDGRLFTFRSPKLTCAIPVVHEWFFSACQLRSSKVTLDDLGSRTPGPIKIPHQFGASVEFNPSIQSQTHFGCGFHHRNIWACHPKTPCCSSDKPTETRCCSIRMPAEGFRARRTMRNERGAKERRCGVHSERPRCNVGSCGKAALNQAGGLKLSSGPYMVVKHPPSWPSGWASLGRGDFCFQGVPRFFGGFTPRLLTCPLLPWF